MQFPVKRVHFGEFAFDVWENVYEPAEDTFLMAENLETETGMQVLDVGTGCGILGVVAAQKAAEVTAIDLNPYAVRCAKQNSTLNKVKGKMSFMQADLLAAFSENAKFDLILFNAPYLPATEKEAETWIGRSWAGGINGRQVIDRFISQVKPCLKSGGRVLLMQSTLADVEETVRAFGEHQLRARVKVELKLPFFETLTLIEAKA